MKTFSPTILILQESKTDNTAPLSYFLHIKLLLCVITDITVKDFIDDYYLDFVHSPLSTSVQFFKNRN